MACTRKIPRTLFQLGKLNSYKVTCPDHTLNCVFVDDRQINVSGAFIRKRQ